MSQYFTKDSFRFLELLEGNNYKEWWYENKKDYERYVKEPLKNLANDVGIIYGEPHIFRPNRDVRFSKDKSPYKTNASFYISDTFGGLYFELSKTGITVGGGLYEPQTDQLEAWRQLFDTAKAIKIKDLLHKASKQDFALMQEGALKTAPRGWTPDHPEIEYLRLKHAVITKHYSYDSWIGNPNIFDELMKNYQLVHDWNMQLKLYVGESRLERKW